MPIKAFPVNKIETIKKHFLRSLNFQGDSIAIFQFKYTWQYS